MHIDRQTSVRIDWRSVVRRLVRIPLKGTGAKITLAFVFVTMAVAGVAFYIWDRIETVFEVNSTMVQRSEIITNAAAVVQNSIFDEIWAVGRFHQGAEEDATQIFRTARDEMDTAIQLLKESRVLNAAEFDSLSVLRHRFHSEVGLMFTLTDSLMSARRAKDVKAAKEFGRSHEQTMTSVDILHQHLEEMLLRLQMRTSELSGENQRVVSAMINQVKLSLVFLSVFLVLVTVAAWFITEWLVTRPLQRLTEQVKSIKMDDLTLPLQTGATDEVKTLEESFKEMLTDLQRNIQKRQEDELELMREHKLAAIGQLAQGIVHNLNNPLSVIQLSSELLMKKQRASPEVEMIAESAQRMKMIIDTLLRKSRQEQAEIKQLINLNELITDELQLLQADHEFKHNVEKDIRLAHDLPPVLGVYSDFSQSIMNIIRNALDAMYRSVRKNLRIETRFDEMNIYVEISDSGCGIPEEHKEKLFDPFFTTKPLKGNEVDNEPTGTGLGLSSCYQLLRSYKATITVKSRLGEGSMFTLIIPHNSYQCAKE